VSKVEKLSIALTGELAESVRVAVKSGDYASSSEVIREALRDWSEKRERRTASLAHVRKLLQDGLDSGLSQRRRSADDIIAEGRRRLGVQD
jgi:antitoxin ParD1/3/4